jgi:hypothetical protein
LPSISGKDFRHHRGISARFLLFKSSPRRGIKALDLFSDLQPPAVFGEGDGGYAAIWEKFYEFLQLAQRLFR